MTEVYVPYNVWIENNTGKHIFRHFYSAVTINVHKQIRKLIDRVEEKVFTCKKCLMLTNNKITNLS